MSDVDYAAARLLDRRQVPALHEGAPPPVIDVVVGRQPVFERSRQVVGYELLLRPAATAHVPLEHADQITAEMVFSTVSIGVERLADHKLMLCRANRAVLSGLVPVLLPPQRTVVVVAYSPRDDPTLLSGCARLVDEGFSLCLELSPAAAPADALLEMARWIRVDFSVWPRAEISMALLRFHGRRLLLAAGIESDDDLAHATMVGFDRFQGYHLARPRPVASRVLDPGRLDLLRLALRLGSTDTPVADLEAIVKQNPALTEHLLRLASGGAGRGLYRPVRTVREALVVVGWLRLQAWVSLLIIAGHVGRWQEGTTDALARARLCELVASSTHCADPETAFMAGLVSSFGELLGLPTAELLDQLPLDVAVKEAVVAHTGPLGDLLADVVDYREGRHGEATRAGVPEAVFAACALKALEWALTVGADMEGLAPR